jgi:hypothetical protein
VGERLPAERQLAADLGASRSSVREAQPKLAPPWPARVCCKAAVAAAPMCWTRKCPSGRAKVSSIR